MLVSPCLFILDNLCQCLLGSLFQIIYVSVSLSLYSRQSMLVSLCLFILDNLCYCLFVSLFYIIYVSVSLSLYSRQLIRLSPFGLTSLVSLYWKSMLQCLLLWYLSYCPLVFPCLFKQSIMLSPLSSLVSLFQEIYCTVPFDFPLLLFSRVATKSNSAYNMINVVRARRGSLLVLRIIGQRSRLQLLKIEHKFDTFFVSARYLKNKMQDLNETWYTYA